MVQRPFRMGRYEDSWSKYTHVLKSELMRPVTCSSYRKLLQGLAVVIFFADGQVTGLCESRDSARREEQAPSLAYTCRCATGVDCVRVC